MSTARVNNSYTVRVLPRRRDQAIESLDAKRSNTGPAAKRNSNPQHANKVYAKRSVKKWSARTVLKAVA
jgi:hypothetical protein